jgi:undecaprenyl-diphosphatase
LAPAVRLDGAHDPDWRLAWAVVAGSLPIGIVGLAAKDLIEGPLRSLWVVGVALIAWSAVMVLAERRARHRRGEHEMRQRDVLLIGLVQCIALVPGVSRSGATISAGLLRFVARHPISAFAPYRVLVGAAVLGLVTGGVLDA